MPEVERVAHHVRAGALRQRRAVPSVEPSSTTSTSKSRRVLVQRVDDPHDGGRLVVRRDHGEVLDRLASIAS